jgi:hypothetical protein
MAFDPIDNPEEMTGDHKNKDKTINSIDNLRWLTREDNSKESHKFGRIYGTCMNSNHRIYELDQIISVCELLQEDECSIPEISSLTDVSCDTIQKIKSRKEWIDISSSYIFPAVKPNKNIKKYSMMIKESIALYITKHPDIGTRDILQNLNMDITNANRMLVNRVRVWLKQGRFDYLFTSSTTIES